MTTINEILEKFNIKYKEKFHETIGKTDIGDYTFTDIDTSTPFIINFTDKNNPNILLRINEDRDNIVLFIKQPDNTVEATNWLLRTDKVIHRTFEDGSQFFKK